MLARTCQIFSLQPFKDDLMLLCYIISLSSTCYLFLVGNNDLQRTQAGFFKQASVWPRPTLAYCGRELHQGSLSLVAGHYLFLLFTEDQTRRRYQLQFFGTFTNLVGGVTACPNGISRLCRFIAASYPVLISSVMIVLGRPSKPPFIHGHFSLVSLYTIEIASVDIRTRARGTAWSESRFTYVRLCPPRACLFPGHPCGTTFLSAVIRSRHDAVCWCWWIRLGGWGGIGQ